MSVIGLDIGGTWIKAGRFSNQLKLEEQLKVRSNGEHGKEALFKSIGETVEQLLDDPETPVGLALPAPVTVDGQRLHYMSNISGMDHWDDEGVAINEAVNEHCKAEKIIANNDVNLAALGEWKFGIAQGDLAARLLHLTWGTGIGSGFVSEGKTHYGWEGGHIPLTIEADGPTVESEIQVPELLKRARELLASGGTTSELQDADLADVAEGSKHLVAVAEAGDALAQQVLNEAATAMAHGLHVLSIIAYPTHVTLGGGIMASKWLLEAVRKEVDRMSVGIRETSLRADIVYQAELGNDAGMTGAAIYAQQYFAE